MKYFVTEIQIINGGRGKCYLRKETMILNNDLGYAS